MKQTIISKCFSKMKRVALALFAALCVGNMWAAIAIDIKDMAFTEDGTLSFQYQLGYSESDSVRYAYLEVEVIDSADNAKISQVLISKEDKLQLKNHDVLDWATATIENIGYTSLDALYADSCALRISFKAFKDGEDFSNEVYEAYLEPSGLTELEATYTVAVKEFIVYGKYDLNAGITGLDLSYALNDATLSNPTVQALTLNADGTFEYRIPYSTDADVLYFSVLVKKGETSVVHRNPESAFKIYEQGIYEGNATYTWTGASDNIWANAANWTYEGDSRLGYPGLENKYHYYVSKVCFNTDAEVDLNAQAYYLWDANRGFEMMTEGITVKLKNGTLGFQPHDDGSRTTLNFGKANSTLILNNLTMPFTVSKPNEWYNLKPVASSTIVVEGDKNYYWRFTPGNKNTKFKVMDGTVQSSYASATPGSGSQLEIENAVYIVKREAASGFAATTTFRDGPDRQARLWLRNSSSGTTYYNLKLYGTYNIKIPETPYANPYVLASLLSANATCTMNIDVSDYKLGAKVPLIQFKGTLNANTKNAMNTMTTTASRLVVKANGVDVKAARNAKLVWDETAKTLYFQQDSQNEASIGTAEYATLGAALDAATAGATIKVLNDVATDAAFVITKKVTIDLNGKTIATTQADTEGNGVFWVKAGGELTLNGEGTINGVGGNAYNIAIWADGGKVTINGGTYTNVGAQDSGPDGAHFDLIYAKNGGSVEINGGTFKCQTPNWTLNSHDTAKGTIVVNGGTFYGFNPANCTTEGANTNFCADGLCGYVVETVDGVDVYGVAAAVATVGEAKFASLDAAIAAAGVEDEVVVVADIATDAAFEITKKVTINLNGKTIATTQADTEGNGVFWVKTGGELTLNGEGTVNGVGGNAYNIAIWADGGKVIINGGTYTNVGAQDDGPDGAHFDLIYVKNGGAVEINGGTFKCQTPEWTLNSHDTKKGTIVVNGGLFYQFNPSDCATEGAGTNWCAEGLKGAESAENAGYYEIVDAWTAPMPDIDDGDTFNIEYTDAVIAALQGAEGVVGVKVNNVVLKGDEAVKALNDAVACFEEAITIDGTTASLDIEIKVTEVNAENPAASTVVVTRNGVPITVKATPTVKYFYPETKTWGSDKPTIGAVLFKLVFEAK